MWGQVRLDDDSRFSFLWLESLAKWGKMGNVIWEKFKFSISLPIEAIVRCSWRGSNYLFNIWLIFHFYEFQSREFPEETNFAYYTKHWLFLRLFSAVISRTGNLPFHCFQFCASTDSTELPAWKVKLFLSRDFVTSFFCQMSLLSKQILLKARQTGIKNWPHDTISLSLYNIGLNLLKKCRFWGMQYQNIRILKVILS